VFWSGNPPPGGELRSCRGCVFHAICTHRLSTNTCSYIIAERLALWLWEGVLERKSDGIRMMFAAIETAN
jgi:hypothetical protein